MTSKDYLCQALILDAKVRRRQRQIRELKDKAVHITTSFDQVRVQSSPSADRTADIVARYMDLEEEMVYLMDQLFRLKDKLIGEIQQLEDVKYMEVLEMRYLDRCTFEQIAGRMCLDVRTVYRLHGKALQAFSEKVMK